MRKPRVLLDTNILVSGLVFTRGNEHRILRAVEDGRLVLVLPEPVLVGTRAVLARKFPGFKGLLDIFLQKVAPETIPLPRILPALRRYAGRVPDPKDTPFYAAARLARADYVVTGNKALREALRASPSVRQRTKICTSRELVTLVGE